MTVEILALNFSIKYGLKVISKAKMKNFRSKIDQGFTWA